MNTSTVRVTDVSRDKLRSLARETGLKQQELLDRAVEALRRQVFLESANAAFAELKADEKAWKEELEERDAWDEAMSDGLEEE
jgi:hypothetical protein